MFFLMIIRLKMTIVLYLSSNRLIYIYKKKKVIRNIQSEKIQKTLENDEKRQNAMKTVNWVDFRVNIPTIKSLIRKITML